MRNESEQSSLSPDNRSRQCIEQVLDSMHKKSERFEQELRILLDVQGIEQSSKVAQQTSPLEITKNHIRDILQHIAYLKKCAEFTFEKLQELNLQTRIECESLRQQLKKQRQTETQQQFTLHFADECDQGQSVLERADAYTSTTGNLSQSEVAVIREQNLRLEKELEVHRRLLQQDRQQFKDTFTKIESEIQNKIVEINELKATLQKQCLQQMQSETDLRLKLKKIEDLESQNFSVESQVVSFKSLKQDLFQQLNENQRIIEEQAQKIRELQRDLHTAHETNEQLLIQVGDMRSNLHNAQTQVQRLQIQIGDFNQKLPLAQEELQKILGDHQTMKIEVQELRKINQELHASRQSYQNVRIEGAGQEIVAKLRRRVQELTEENKRIKLEKSQLSTSLDYLSRLEAFFDQENRHKTNEQSLNSSSQGIFIQQGGGAQQQQHIAQQNQWLKRRVTELENFLNIFVNQRQQQIQSNTKTPSSKKKNSNSSPNVSTGSPNSKLTQSSLNEKQLPLISEDDFE